MEEERKVVGPMAPPKFPGEEAFKEAHERFLQWQSSEEGQRLLKEKLSPERYAEYLKALELTKTE